MTQSFAANRRPSSRVTSALVFVGALMLAPVAFSSDEVNLAVSIYTQGAPSRSVHCDPALAGMPIPSTLIWEYWDASFWQPISLNKDDTRAFTRNTTKK